MGGSNNTNTERPSNGPHFFAPAWDGGSLNSSPPTRCFEPTAENIKTLAGGLCGLEHSFGSIWDTEPQAPDYKKAIRLLENYSQAWLFTLRNNRAAFGELVAELEKAKALSKEIIDQVKELYASLSNPKGSAARHLEYLLLHCSGLYSEAVRDEVKTEIAALVEGKDPYEALCTR